MPTTECQRGRRDGVILTNCCYFGIGIAALLTAIYQYKSFRRSQNPLVRKSIKMKRDSPLLLPLWRRPFPRKWVKVDEEGVVDAKSPGLDGVTLAEVQWELFEKAD